MKRIATLLVLLVAVLQVQAELSLDSCRHLALRHNKDLLIAQQKVKAAKSMKKAAFTQYLPNISANGAYLWNEKNFSLLGEDKLLPVGTKMADGSFGFTADQVSNNWTMVNGSPVPLDADGAPFNPKTNPEKIQWKNYAYIPEEEFEVDMENVFVGSIMLTQPIFMGGKIIEMNRIAKFTEQIAEAKLDGQTSEVLLQTDAAYWRVVSLKNKEKLAQSYVDLLKKMDSDMEKTIAFGVATKSDGLSVKVKLNEAQMTLVKVQNGLGLSKMALSQLCGLPLDSVYSLADEDIDPLVEKVDPVLDVEGAIDNRYEISALKNKVDIAESNRKIMISRFLPNAGLTAGYIVSNPSMFNGVQNEFDGMWQVGVAVNIPLFHFGERFHTLQAAKVEKKIAEYELEEAREKIKLDISQASFKITEADRKVVLTKTNKEQAEENLRFATVGFESGVVEPTVLMQAQTAWLKANSEDIDARIDQRLCEVYLLKAIGNLK